MSLTKIFRPLAYLILILLGLQIMIPLVTFFIYHYSPLVFLVSTITSTSTSIIGLFVFFGKFRNHPLFGKAIRFHKWYIITLTFLIAISFIGGFGMGFYIILFNIFLPIVICAVIGIIIYTILENKREFWYILEESVDDLENKLKTYHHF